MVEGLVINVHGLSKKRLTSRKPERAKRDVYRSTGAFMHQSAIITFHRGDELKPATAYVRGLASFYCYQIFPAVECASRLLQQKAAKR